MVASQLTSRRFVPGKSIYVFRRFLIEEECCKSQLCIQIKRFIIRSCGSYLVVFVFRRPNSERLKFSGIVYVYDLSLKTSKDVFKTIEPLLPTSKRSLP